MWNRAGYVGKALFVVVPCLIFVLLAMFAELVGPHFPEIDVVPCVCVVCMLLVFAVYKCSQKHISSSRFHQGMLFPGFIWQRCRGQTCNQTVNIIYIYTVCSALSPRRAYSCACCAFFLFGGAKDAGYSEPLSAHQLLYPAEGGTRRLLLALLSMLPPDGVRKKETLHFVKTGRSPVGGVMEVL